MDIIERIQQIIVHEGLNVSSFSRKIGVGDQTIRGIVVQKRNNPGYDVIAKIIQTFNWVDPEWLITGQGEMIKKTLLNKDENTNTLTELVEYLREKDVKIEKLIEEKAEYKFKYEMAQLYQHSKGV